jgi:hypothetical protein
MDTLRCVICKLLEKGLLIQGKVVDGLKFGLVCVKFIEPGSCLRDTGVTISSCVKFPDFFELICMLQKQLIKIVLRLV